MQRISFGIVGLFGILMPGALLLINIFFPLFIIYCSINRFADNAGYKMDTVIILALVLLAFTLGTILRTLPPRWAEWPYRHFSKWSFNNLLVAYLENPQREHFSSIPDDVWNRHCNPLNVDEKRKYWRHMRLFNFAKNYVIAKSERLAREVQTAEGLSRFIASVFWCSLAGVLISTIVFIFAFINKKSSNCFDVSIYFVLTNLLIFLGSARGIGPIREHEGEVVMQSFFCIRLLTQDKIGDDGN